MSVIAARSIRSLFVLLCGTASLVQAQTGVRPSGGVAPSRDFETRAELVAQHKTAESQRRTAEAWLLKSRLEKGDFQEGDRIVVVIDGSTVISDTMQVRAGKLLPFPRMGEVALAGVLRSELSDTVRHHLARYLNNPSVRVTPLLPIAVAGQVLTPGYHYVPADVVLRDVLMRAGGPLAAADLGKVVIRRNQEIIWNADAVRVALSDGLSLDGLHLRAGDEIYVPERRRMEMANLTTIISTLVALTLAVVQLTQ